MCFCAADKRADSIKAAGAAVLFSVAVLFSLFFCLFFIFACHLQSKEKRPLAVGGGEITECFLFPVIMLNTISIVIIIISMISENRPGVEILRTV